MRRRVEANDFSVDNISGSAQALDEKKAKVNVEFILRLTFLCTFSLF